MCRILRQLPLDEQLLFFRMPQFPIELDDGMADVTQFIVRQPPLQFVVKFLALLCLYGKLAQVAYMPTDSLCVEIQNQSEQQREEYGEKDVRIVRLQ